MGVKKVRMMPGGYRCPVCRHIVSSSQVCEITDTGKRKGKRICFDCGIAYLAGRSFATNKKAGPVQSKGQRQLSI